jgi:rRNA maturation endonuclease Nob1
MKGMKRMLGRAKVELHAKREPYMQRVCLPRKVVTFLGSKGGDDVFYFEDKSGLVVIMSQRQVEERSAEDEKTPRFSRGTVLRCGCGWVFPIKSKRQRRCPKCGADFKLGSYEVVNEGLA